tara:strand:+ start:1190 stop:1645 length:456 start_codon:yes stop_codon:yes gene_type:complete
MASKYHTTKDGRKAKKGLYYYMNRAKKRGTSKPGKGTVTDKALTDSAKTAKKRYGGCADCMRAGGVKSPAWQRKEGQSPSGGLNAKGRASAKKQGDNLKPPVTESNPKGKKKKRKASFCARMKGMKRKLTGSKKRNDPNSRINKSLSKWKC